MAEPNTSTIAFGIAVGAPPAVTVGMTILGAQADALIIGLLAGGLVSMWLHEINSVVRAASAVAFSSLLAGYGSPIAAGVMAFGLAKIMPVAPDPESLRMLAALSLGGASPGVIPPLLTRARGIAKGGPQ